MIDRKLKNYPEYMNRLRLFAKATGIKIVYGELDSDGGVWMPEYSRIRLEEDLSNSVEVASLLHELGHSVDDLLKLPEVKHTGLGKAYEAYYAGKHTRKQKNLVIECEKRAWKAGRDIAKRLKIRLGAWYDIVEATFLSTYEG